MTQKPLKSAMITFVLTLAVGAAFQWWFGPPFTPASVVSIVAAGAGAALGLHFWEKRAKP